MNELSLEELAARIDGLKEDIKKKVSEVEFLYVGNGANEQFFAGKSLFRMVCDQLKDEGYKIHYLRKSDTDSEGVLKILTDENVRYQKVWEGRENIRETLPTQIL